MGNQILTNGAQSPAGLAQRPQSESPFGDLKPPSGPDHLSPESFTMPLVEPSQDNVALYAIADDITPQEIEKGQRNVLIVAVRTGGADLLTDPGTLSQAEVKARELQRDYPFVVEVEKVSDRMPLRDKNPWAERCSDTK